jgi:molybdopterin/thiamine biosynthesis adenylyltransferase
MRVDGSAKGVTMGEINSNSDVEPKIVGVSSVDDSKTERQERLLGWDQEKIENTTVLVIGAGALGNEICKNLALLGIGKIILVDFDDIVLSNLNRCIFFREHDIKGKYLKVDVVKREISKLNPETMVVPIADKIENLDAEIYEETDVAVGAVDNDAARLELNYMCFQHGIPLVDGGIHGFRGNVKVVFPPHSACLACNLTFLDYASIYKKDPCTGEDVETNDPKLPGIATTSSIISALQVQEVLKIVQGIDEFKAEGHWNEEIGIPIVGKVLFFNGVNNYTNIYGIKKDPFCPVCGSSDFG